MLSSSSYSSSFSSTHVSCDNYASFHNNCVSVCDDCFKSCLFYTMVHLHTYFWLICKVAIHFRMGNVCELQLSCNTSWIVYFWETHQLQRWTRLIDSRGFVIFVPNPKYWIQWEIKYESFLRERVVSSLRHYETVNFSGMQSKYAQSRARALSSLFLNRNSFGNTHSYVGKEGCGRGERGWRQDLCSGICIERRDWLNVQKRGTDYVTRQWLMNLLHKMARYVFSCETVRDQMVTMEMQCHHWPNYSMR